MESVSGVASEGPTAYFILKVPSSGVAVLLTAIALLLPILLRIHKKYRKMQEDSKTPFPFLELPQELRDMVYEHLLEEHPAYPPPPTCPKHASAMDWMLPGHWSSTSPQPKPSNWIMLTNKQIHEEYMKLLCQRATFRLTVSPQNYQNPCATPTSTHPSDKKIWHIAPSTLQQIRSCDLSLIATSSMLGVTDPRNMTSSDWTLAAQIRRELSFLTNVSNFTLDAKAIADPLWNPLWIWYHACQSFRYITSPQSGSVSAGPRLNRITFSLDTWSPGENFLMRDEKNRGEWTWYCMKGHSVGLDCGEDMTVREFCAKLYQECRVCRPELDSEDEEQ
ncbi:hypothetical protein HBI56_049960 [Parastagonospora nodorum]|uniref:Uncharacterized protein n=1 Tax=Phaeosphaeria nodorum (strain SN15 / ATCC MYA-4574 / FGSC 10173) TaxID=321614 RepID=A0A7U2ES68_PHANO|nr:hypothetical protein HBH56_062890 [Parastagonospora nodorum]QRC92096.1 hypothetical protein JI435_022610 [Parastagonospora nodorum SN15]KAH3930942.1 hypothetical protein HBH54_106830 [Parastagonospora nodorum]KAH3954535.1 hypothetical protein HBH53_021770 [Parastagonospora nodorum]KAH3968036.1 hypothetical protein HBH51_131900 [Parastagonospora nodorum]